MPLVAWLAVTVVTLGIPLVTVPKPPTTPVVVPSVVETPLPLVLNDVPIRVAALAAESTVS